MVNSFEQGLSYCVFEEWVSLRVFQVNYKPPKQPHPQQNKPTGINPEFCLFLRVTSTQVLLVPFPTTLEMDLRIIFELSYDFK